MATTATANTLPARVARRKKRNAKPDLNAVALLVWDAIQTAHALLKDADPDRQLKAVHAVCQASTAYSKLYEVGELEARLEALEGRA